jgi:DNA polymerase III subunit delta'
LLYAEHWPIFGHQWAVEHLAQALNGGRSRHAYLITGTSGIGKTTFARILAMALNCIAEDGRPCGECRSCTLIERGGHPDVTIMEAERVGGQLKIEQVRELQRTVALRPYEARHRVAILRRFHEANPAASNALLKTLEEPPRNVVLILTADDVKLLLPTILSRCQHLPLRALPAEDIANALEQHWNVPQADAQLLARLSAGRIGWAIRAMENDDLLRRRADGLALLEGLLNQNRSARFAEAEKLAKDKGATVELLQHWQSYWRDVLLAGQDSSKWIVNVDYQPTIEAWARRVPGDVQRQALEATQRTLNYLQRNVNARLALETLMLDYPLMKGKQT